MHVCAVVRPQTSRLAACHRAGVEGTGALWHRTGLAVPELANFTAEACLLSLGFDGQM